MPKGTPPTNRIPMPVFDAKAFARILHRNAHGPFFIPLSHLR